MKILLVEHNQTIIDKLKTLLRNNSYIIDVSKDGQDSLEIVKMFEYDLLIVNVNVTKIDGISLCKQIRKNGKQMPILLFTDKQNHEDKRIAGLDSGADDFVVINQSEEDIFLAKIRALSRRSGGILPPILSWRNIELDPVKHQVKHNNNPLILTPTEYKLLELFMRNSQRIYSLSNIIDAIWSYEEIPNETTIRSHIKSLRKKLTGAGVPEDVIETVYGVGYRLKTVNENDQPEMIDQKNRPSNGHNNNGNNQVEIDSDLVEIFQKSHTLLDARISILESVVHALENGEYTKQLGEKAAQESHKLISSLGTFGFHNESEITRSLNNTFKTEKNINRQKIKLISKQVKQLRSVLETCPLPPLSQEFAKGEVSTILMITSEISLLEKLDIEASKWGIQTEMATNLEKAKEIITKNNPDLILLDLEISYKTEECLIFLEQINHQKIPIPILILTNRDNLKERVKISSLGGKGFLSKSLLIPDIIKTAINLLEQSIPKESRIMVVDDDPIALAFVKSYLEPWGLKVKVVEKIDDFWQTLNDFCPYLLILDMEMPSMGGVDLCRLVRSDSRWASLPIIFLTSHRDPTAINQAFANGADDFVNKPIEGSELVVRVINRIERVKSLRKSTEVDPVIGVIHRNRFVERFISFLCLAERYHHHLCIVVIKMTNLDEIKQQYDLSVADQLSMALGKYLKHKLRREDMITSWQDGIFVVSMYPSTKEGIEGRLNKIFKLLQYHDFQVSYDSDTISLQAECSCGIAQFPENGRDIQTLYDYGKNQLK
jgi:DNA-binding response OmpR family regulator